MNNIKVRDGRLHVICQKVLERISPLIKNDRLYLKLMFHLRVGYSLNLEDPKTFNEKLNWLKIYYHNPIMPMLADKFAVKEIVAKLIGQEYVVNNYGVWDDFDDIDFNKLPDKFVLKTTNDSMGVIVCKDKKSFDVLAAKKQIGKGSKSNYFYAKREWVYKDIPRRIIADQYLEDGTGMQLRDYKFWCFNGVPKYMYFTIKGEKSYENFYDMDFNIVDIDHGFKRFVPEFVRPEAYEEMKHLAEIISKDLPFARIDFFYVKGKVYFGEVTFYDWAGMRAFSNYDTDLKLGELITLPNPLL